MSYMGTIVIRSFRVSITGWANWNTELELCCIEQKSLPKIVKSEKVLSRLLESMSNRQDLNSRDFFRKGTKDKEDWINQVLNNGNEY